MPSLAAWASGRGRLQKRRGTGHIWPMAKRVRKRERDYEWEVIRATTLESWPAVVPNVRATPISLAS